MSIEELAALEVTSVSKRPESRLEAAAAVYVITGEQIRRSGVTSIPEALRLAPGVEVARWMPTPGRSRSAASTARPPTSCWC
jgi:iron complex outermembrane receptor protein